MIYYLNLLHVTIDEVFYKSSLLQFRQGKCNSFPYGCNMFPDLLIQLSGTERGEGQYICWGLIGKTVIDYARQMALTRKRCLPLATE